MEEIYQVRLEDRVIARNGAVKLAKPLQSTTHFQIRALGGFRAACILRRFVLFVHGWVELFVQGYPKDTVELAQELSDVVTGD